MVSDTDFMGFYLWMGLTSRSRLFKTDRSARPGQEVMRTRVRRADGRKKGSSAAIVDSQSVKTAEGGVKGYDAGPDEGGRPRVGRAIGPDSRSPR